MNGLPRRFPTEPTLATTAVPLAAPAVVHGPGACRRSGRACFGAGAATAAR